MIVIVGAPAWRDAEPAGPAGRTCDIALAAAARGARPELVGRVGEDRTGDDLLIALARAGVGHAAVLRDPARPTPRAAAAASPDGLDAVDEEPAVPDATAAWDGRTTGPRLEPADVALGLAYLTSFGVLVVADDAPADVVPVCVERAAFAGAQLVVLVPEGRPVPDGIPPLATVLSAPAVEDDGAFASLVGVYAAGLDRGDDPADAFRAATGEGWVVPGA